MNLGRGGTWAQARAAGVDEHTIDRQPVGRDAYYRHGPRHGLSLAPGSSGEGDVDAELRVA